MIDQVRELQLDNGFRAFLLPRGGLPVVSSMLWYRVGARDERTTQTGVSHFLEHMMFKGTDNYKKGEIDLLTSKAGGSNNAFTDNDVTAYYFSLAADRWEMALEIEANRMHGCLLDEEEFEAEKSVVLEELSMYQDDPWSNLFQATEVMTYQVHPYHHPVIGWREDLERLPVSGMRDYYQQHYGPDRSFLVVAGDIDVKRASQRIEELFGDLPVTGRARREVLPEPAPAGERRGIIRFKGQITRMAFAFQTCRVGETDDFVLDVICCALGTGRTSRLQKRLVIDDQVATSVGVYNETRLDPGLFSVIVEVTPGVSPERVESIVREEIDRLCVSGLTGTELRRARTQLRATFLLEEESVSSLAMRTGRYEGSAEAGYKLLKDVPQVYDGIDSKAVKQVARRYFGTDSWRVVWSLPPAESGTPTKKQATKKQSTKKKATKKKAAKKSKAKAKIKAIKANKAAKKKASAKNKKKATR